MPRINKTFIKLLSFVMCLTVNVYGGKRDLRPNFVLIVADDMGWSEKPINIGVECTYAGKCLENALQSVPQKGHF